MQVLAIWHDDHVCVVVNLLPMSYLSESLLAQRYYKFPVSHACIEMRGISS